MPDPALMQQLLAARRPGLSLPGPFYNDPAVFQADLDAVFAADWIFACNACEVPRPGDYLTLAVGGSSVIVLRGRDGRVQAWHNTCRHRGSRLCLEERGHANRLVCPYHQWVYELDGSLLHARQMPPSFDASQHGLLPVATEMVCGMVYICLADDPPDLGRFRRTVTPYLAPHQPDRTKVAHAETLVEHANWKLVIENNRECYHCSANHPELLATLVEAALPDAPEVVGRTAELFARKGAAWDALGLPHAPADGGTEFRCIRLPFHEGALSFTLDGGPACRKLLGDLVEPDLGSVRMFRVPNNWNHFLADHIIHFRILPLGPHRTALRTTWLVHEDAVEGVDYDVDRLTAVWRATNGQDSRLCEVNQLGVASRAYRPGPYAPSEFLLHQFSDWYVGKLEAAYVPAAQGGRAMQAAE